MITTDPRGIVHARPQAINPPGMGSSEGVEVGHVGRSSAWVRQPLENADQVSSGVAARAVDRLIVERVGEHKRQVLSEDGLEVGLPNCRHVLNAGSRAEH